MLVKFDGKFLTTRDFSAYAGLTLKEDFDTRAEPGIAILARIACKEILFRTLEHYLIYPNQPHQPHQPHQPQAAIVKEFGLVLGFI